MILAYLNFQEIKIVSTARQQKLKVPFVSNEECIERFQDFGANLENDLRFDFFCFKRLFFMEILLVLINICVLVGRRVKTVVR